MNVRAAAVFLLCAALAGAGTLDLAGNPKDPFASPAQARVFLFVRTDCPITNRYAPELRRISTEFKSRGVEFWLVYPDPSQSVEGIERHMADYGFPGRPLRDPHHDLVRRAKATIAPEAAVFNAEGRIDVSRPHRRPVCGRWDGSPVRADARSRRRDRRSARRQTGFENGNAGGGVFAGGCAMRLLRSFTSLRENYPRASAQGCLDSAKALEWQPCPEGRGLKRAVFTPALAVAVLLAIPAAAQTPTFAHDITPIVYRSCAPCHRPGEAGPFSLITYDDVKKHASQIVDVTRRRYMPPWLPERGKGDFQDELRLTADQIQTIANWVAAGAPEGNPAQIPPPPHFTEGWQLGPPDLILQAPQAFSLPASGTDIYWNFIFTANIPKRRWVRAIEIRPGNARLIHHANLYVDRAHSARAQEIAPGKGFPGMDPIIERTVFEPDDGHFLYWKPGGIPYSEPRGAFLASRSRQRPGAQRAHAAGRKTGAGPPVHRAIFYRQAADALPDAGATGTRRRARYSRRRSAISWSRTISSSRWMLTFWPCIRTRIISGTCSKATRRCPRRAQLAGPHSRLGPQLGSRVSLSRAGVLCRRVR